MSGSLATSMVVVLLILAIIVIVVLMMLYGQLQAQNRQLRESQGQAQAQYERVQSEYLQIQTRLNDLAREQFADWRDRELATLSQQLESAARERAHAAAERWFLENERRIRDEAIRQSASVVTGKVTEHLTPYIGRFPYNPKDVRFLGSPIDLIVFNGLSEGSLKEVVFLEIKTGASSLSTGQRSIRNVLQAGGVRWDEFRIPTTNGAVST